MKVLITGGKGFVGKHLSKLLKENGVDVIEYDRVNDSPKSFIGFDGIVHLAAKVHDFHCQTYDDYYEGNVRLTKKLADRCVSDGVAKFVFMSSIKVNGEGSVRPYEKRDLPNPMDFYGRSKWEAEKILLERASDHPTFSYVVIRPPLIYGPGVGANFRSLFKLANLPFPIPFGSIKNSRSLIYVGNLISLIYECLKNKNIQNKTFLVSDTEDVSTTFLINNLKINQSGLRRFFNVSFPVPVLSFLLKLAGMQKLVPKLFGNLQIKANYEEIEGGWCPPFCVSEALKVTREELDRR